MIERIKILPEEEIDFSSGAVNEVWADTPLSRKLNEIIDAVNDITDWIKRTDETIVKYGIKPIENGKISKMDNVDPYAEQRKWIGKVCWLGCYNQRRITMKDIIKALKVLFQQYEIAYQALQKIADPKYQMRMVEAQRALEKIEKVEQNNKKE